MTATPETLDLAVYPDPHTIQEIIHGAKTIAIVGLSANVLRPSNFVGFYLQRHGYHIVPVNPRENEILGEKSYASLKDIPFHVDVVDVFRAPPAVPGIAREAVEIGADALWLQFEVISPEGAEIAREGGLAVVMVWSSILPPPLPGCERGGALGCPPSRRGGVPTCARPAERHES